MDNNFLLTFDYDRLSDGDDVIIPSYEWFETEEELLDFVRENNISVNEAYEIKDCRNIEIE